MVKNDEDSLNNDNYNYDGNNVDIEKENGVHNDGDNDVTMAIRLQRWC